MIHLLRTFYYKIKYQFIFRNAIFGKGTLIKCKLSIKGPGKVVIGCDCIFDTDPWGEDWVTLFTHRRKARITIGDRVVLRAPRFGSHLLITIQNDAIVESASIFDSDFHNIDASKRDEDFNKGDREVLICKKSYVGCECLVSKGTVLGEKAIILPGSVIGTKTLPTGDIALGNPARALKPVVTAG
jgi:hypothetical protein